MNKFLTSDKLVITSPYGYRTHPVTGEQNSFHPGIDIRAKFVGILAPQPGIVLSIGNGDIAGLSIRIQHNDNTQTRYVHLSNIQVRKGDIIKSGDMIGVSGNSGRCIGAHLHFERKIYNKDKQCYELVDPEAYAKLLWSISKIKKVGLPTICITSVLILILYT